MIQENVSLKPYNTFGVEATAKWFYTIESIQDFKHLFEENWLRKKLLILGGGSNVLFTNNFDGIVMRNEFKGLKILKETEKFALVEANSGENWHEFVLWALNHNFGGVENLSLIPGKVGAAPMQNIGAYGVEIKDVFHSLEAFDVASGKFKTFDLEQCKFGYRESIFKNEYKNRFFITSVVFKLSKKNHEIHTNYGVIQKQLKENQVSVPTIQDVSNAVIQIRKNKLPDPKKIGNGGSFFKNPTIPFDQFQEIQSNFPEIPHYKQANSRIKLAAGWLIEQSGWRGKRIKNAGVHEKQALVLVNHGNASGKEIYTLSQIIQNDVWEKYGINLEREVNLIG